MIQSILPYAQIILSIALIGLVLLQRSDTDWSGTLSGGNTGVRHTRRGFEKLTFRMTIAVSVLFALSALLAILL